MTGKALTFVLRLSSTIGLWVVILAMILSGYEICFYFLIAGLGVIGLWEYFAMLRASAIPCFTGVGMFCGAAFLTASFLYIRSYGAVSSSDFDVAAVTASILLVCVWQMRKTIQAREPLENIAYTLFGLLYVPFLFNFLAKIVYLTPRLPESDWLTGQFYVIYLIAVAKFSDMGAYFFGMLFGKHPAVPHISPQKTWEGFVGGMGTALFASWLMVVCMPERLSLFRTIDLIILPLLLGLGAILGDLAESIIKRSTKTKDSSHILPGIGGTLDLIDSILFTAPILYFYLRWVLKVGV